MTKPILIYVCSSPDVILTKSNKCQKPFKTANKEILISCLSCRKIVITSERSELKLFESNSPDFEPYFPHFFDLFELQFVFKIQIFVTQQVKIGKRFRGFTVGWNRNKVPCLIFPGFLIRFMSPKAQEQIASLCKLSQGLQLAQQVSFFLQ